MDPRMIAQTWVLQHVTKGETTENYYYSPSWDLLPCADYVVIKAPYLSGRSRRFQEELGSILFLIQRMNEIENNDVETEKWYSLTDLTEGSPDYIALNSLIFNRFINND